jgi:hypothetical protein
MNFYEFDNILKENQGQTMPTAMPDQNVGGSSGPKFQTLNIASKGLRDDKKNLSPAAFNGLQQLYKALKVLGEKDPGTLLGIVRRMKTSLAKENPELSKILNISANKLVAGLN